MCLKQVDKVITRKYGVGWKVVFKDVDEKGDHFLCWDNYGKQRSVEYLYLKWLTDKNTETISKYDVSYPAGFHIMLEKESAVRVFKNNKSDDDDITIIKCKFRKVVAQDSSKSGYGKVVVAREIMNLGEEITDDN